MASLSYELFFEFLAQSKARFCQFDQDNHDCNISHFTCLTIQETQGAALALPSMVLDCRAASFLAFNYLVAAYARDISPDTTRMHVPREGDNEMRHEQYQNARVATQKLLKTRSSKVYATRLVLEYIRFDDLYRELLGVEPRTGERIKPCILPYGVRFDCFGWWLFRLPNKFPLSRVPEWMRDEQLSSSSRPLYLGFSEHGWRVYTLGRAKDLIFEAWERQSNVLIEKYPNGVGQTKFQALAGFLSSLKMTERRPKRESISVDTQCSAIVFGVSL